MCRTHMESRSTLSPHLPRHLQVPLRRPAPLLLFPQLERAATLTVIITLLRRLPPAPDLQLLLAVRVRLGTAITPLALQ